MSYQNPKIAEVAEVLKKRLEKLDNKADILKAVELKALYSEIPTLAEGERAGFGKEINDLRKELESLALTTHSSQLTDSFASRANASPFMVFSFWDSGSLTTTV